MFRRTVNGSMNFCEVAAIGYRYHECGSGYYGLGCETQCLCGDMCDDVSGLCPTNCEPGWQQPDCLIHCEDGMWGKDCLEYCHCFDPGELCSKDDGVCSSGCADNWKSLSCTEACRGGYSRGICVDPSLAGVLIEGKVNQTNVTVTWQRSDTNLLFLYSIQWRVYKNFWSLWNNGRIVPEPFYTLTLPYMNTLYEVRAVPYETNTNKIGEQSETDTIITGCPGVGCENMCQCLLNPSQLCLRTTLICYQTCVDDHLGDICNIFIPGILEDVVFSQVTYLSAICSFNVSNGETHGLPSTPINMFEVLFNSGNKNWDTQNVSVASTSRNRHTGRISNLSPSQHYQIKVTPFYFFNNSVFRGFTSNVFNLTTPKKVFITSSPTTIEDFKSTDSLEANNSIVNVVTTEKFDKEYLSTASEFSTDGWESTGYEELFTASLEYSDVFDREVLLDGTETSTNHTSTTSQNNTITHPPHPPQNNTITHPPHRLQHTWNSTITHPPHLLQSMWNHTITHPPQRLQSTWNNTITHPPHRPQYTWNSTITHPPHLLQSMWNHTITHPPQRLQSTWNKTITHPPQSK